MTGTASPSSGGGGRNPWDIGLTRDGGCCAPPAGRLVRCLLVFTALEDGRRGNIVSFNTTSERPSNFWETPSAKMSGGRFPHSTKQGKKGTAKATATLAPQSCPQTERQQPAVVANRKHSRKTLRSPRKLPQQNPVLCMLQGLTQSHRRAFQVDFPQSSPHLSSCLDLLHTAQIMKRPLPHLWSLCKAHSASAFLLSPDFLQLAAWCNSSRV